MSMIPLPTGHQQECPPYKSGSAQGFPSAKGVFSPAIVACSRVRLLFAIEPIPVVMDAI